MALIENVQRTDLNPIEEAEAYSKLIEKFGYTQEETAKRVGKQRSTITNLLRLLKLPKLIQSDISSGVLSEGHGRVLIRLIEEPLKIKENGEVYGKARILESTPMGKIAADLMREGVVIGLSSRGLGEIAEKEIMNEETGEKEMVNEVSDFSIASFDLVSEPSIGMFVSQSKQEEKIVRPEEKKIQEKKNLNSGDLVSLSEILFEE